MSYCFDVMERVWRDRIRPLVVERHGERLAFRFESMLDALHSANHRVPSADGIFDGDGVNHDRDVTRAAQALEKAAQEPPDQTRKVIKVLDKMINELKDAPTEKAVSGIAGAARAFVMLGLISPDEEYIWTEMAKAKAEVENDGR